MTAMACPGCKGNMMAGPPPEGFYGDYYTCEPCALAHYVPLSLWWFIGPLLLLGAAGLILLAFAVVGKGQ